MRLGSLELPPPHALPVWLPLDREREVEEELGEGGRMVEVVCSSGGRMVWARDSRQGVWARVGVYPDLPLGTGWVPVTGLAVTDWVGDSWQAVSGWDSESRAVDLSVGQCDTVWTLGKNTLDRT